MWAQLIEARIKPGSEGDLKVLVDELQAAEQPGSGLVRAFAMRDQADPDRALMLVVFEDEAAARAREADPARAEALTAARATMAEMFEGDLSFTDLIVDGEMLP